MRILWCLLAAYFLIALISHGIHDDSDPPDGHSGLSVFHDELTGCEYVGAILYGFTPRLTAEGKPLCRKENPNAH